MCASLSNHRSNMLTGFLAEVTKDMDKSWRSREISVCNIGTSVANFSDFSCSLFYVRGNLLHCGRFWVWNSVCSPAKYQIIATLKESFKDRTFEEERTRNAIKLDYIMKM